MKDSTLRYLFPSSEGGVRSPLQYVLDVLFFLLFFVTPILISVNVKQVFNAPKYLFVGLLATLAVATWLVSSVQRRELCLPRQPTFVFFALLICWEGLTILRSPGADLSLREFGVQASLFFLCLVAAANIRDRERIENLLHFSIAAGVVAAGFGLLQYYKLDEVIFPAVGGVFGVDLTWLILPQKPEEYLKIYSTMGHRNYLAGYLICVLPVVFSRFLSSISVATQRNRYARVAWRQAFVYGASFLVMFAVVLLTHTRGSWVGLTVGMLCFVVILAFKFRALPLLRGGTILAIMLLTAVVVFGSKSLHPALISAVACLGLGAAASVALCRGRALAAALGVSLVVASAVGAVMVFVAHSGENPLTRMHQSALKRFTESFDLRRGSAFQRVLIWSTAWAIITDDVDNFLFGTGIGTFGLNYMPFQAKLLAQPKYEEFTLMVNKSIYAHSEYLHFWSEIGLVGILLLAAMALAFGWSMLAYIARCEANYQNLLLVGMFCSTVAVLSHNVFSFSLHLPYTSSLFYCLIAFCLRYAGIPDVRLTWGRPSTATGHVRMGDGWLGLSIVPLVGGGFRCWAGWLSPPSRSTEPKGCTLVVLQPGGKALEKPLPVPHDEPVVIERKGTPQGWSVEVNDGTTTVGRVTVPRSDDDDAPLVGLGGWAGILCLVVLTALVVDVLALNLALDYHWRNAFLKFRMRHFEESVIDFQRALACDPYRGEILFDYGRALMDSNRNMLAIRQFEKAKRNFVDPANDHNIALCYYKEGKVDEAERHYRKALDLNVIYEQSLANLAFYLVGVERVDEARVLLERGLKYYRRNPQFYSSMGVLEARDKNMARAEELLRKALELDPNHVSTKVNLATILFNQKRYAEALELYEQLVKARPDDALIRRKHLGTLACLYRDRLAENQNDADAVRSLAITYAQLGQVAPEYNREAVRLLRAYLERLPQDGEVRYHLALALQHMGYYGEALSEIQAARATLPPASPLVKQASDTIRILQLKLKTSPPRQGPVPAGGVGGAPSLEDAGGADPLLLPLGQD